MINDNNPYVNWFRHSSPYINAHRGKTFVLMLGGEALADTNFGNIIHDITLLNSLGVKLVLVHGSRPQIEAKLEQQQISDKVHHHLRVTDSDTLQCVIEAAASLRTEIEAKLSMGLANSPMHGAQIRVCSGNFVTARPVGIYKGIDLCHTGEVRRVDSEAIRQQLSINNIVLLSHLGYSPTGEIFNLAVEDVATQVAISLNADKLIMFGEDGGVRDSNNELRSEILADTAERLVSQYMAKHDEPDQTPSELSRHLKAAVEASRNAVPRSHLISYREDGALVSELFSRNGIGTMVIEQSYEQIRPATIEDVGGILELIQPMEQAGVLVRRSRELLEAEISCFTVISLDGAIVGCAALYPFKEERAAELACVAIAPEYRGGDRGENLLQAIEESARRQQLNRLFVLTTRTAHWFIERGFIETEVSNLPNGKQALYNFQRNSKAFSKSI
ncbi:amino-acid N-acetyltransferase [Amphritea japonica]|uniref:Amino-acid acetyltransferase n=1 Tax=Amphritea japonica ATCC BAA-1530 TaxID=1278309 RepID=A0A7R6SRH3_9GAMM|nr:amino-acid N-acetyltransferase [Amphritea japonica]BBB24795.1 amino-acid N-acetyltransferase [Amphritea japonica ATCC BAA-1530]